MLPNGLEFRIQATDSSHYGDLCTHCQNSHTNNKNRLPPIQFQGNFAEGTLAIQYKSWWENQNAVFSKKQHAVCPFGEAWGTPPPIPRTLKQGSKTRPLVSIQADILPALEVHLNNV